MFGRLGAKVAFQYDQLVIRLAQQQGGIDRLKWIHAHGLYTAKEFHPAEETLPTPARPGTRMPSQSPALEISSRSVPIRAVTRGNFATPRIQLYKIFPTKVLAVPSS